MDWLHTSSLKGALILLYQYLPLQLKGECDAHTSLAMAETLQVDILLRRYVSNVNAASSTNARLQSTQSRRK